MSPFHVQEVSTHAESGHIFSTGSHTLLLYMPDCFTGSRDEAARMCVSGGNAGREKKKKKEKTRGVARSKAASPAGWLPERLPP